MAKKWLLYGATGTAGKRVLRTYQSYGLPNPIIAGRNRERTEALAQELELEYRVFDLADDERLLASLEDIDLVLHCAGPFARTSAPMVSACLQTGTHYLDITGEIDVFRACHDLHEKAHAEGIVVMPGVGQDIVPTDCLSVWLKEALPDANSLELALVQTGSAPSAGTMKTTLEGIAIGNRVMHEGEITAKRLGHKTIDVPFADQERRCRSIPLGEVYSSSWSTGIPNITIYGALSCPAVFFARLARPLLRLGFVLRFAQRLVDRFLPESVPTADTRSQFWGRVTNESNKSASARLSLAGGGVMTPQVACAAVKGVLEGSVPPGATTPGAAFGPRWIEQWGEIVPC